MTVSAIIASWARSLSGELTPWQGDGKGKTAMTRLAGTDRIFISRSGADKDTAVWAANALEGSGYACIVQDRDFRIGASFPKNMREAFEQCDTTLALMSPDYWASPFCSDEWDAAYALDRSGLGKLIPVMARPSAPPRLVAHLAYFDLVKAPADRREQLLRRAVDGVVKGTGSLDETLAPNADPHTNASFETAHFAGRDAELEALHRALWGADGAAALTQPAAVHGLGGIGKSAIGKEFAKRHLHRYCLAWFVRAEHEGTLAEDLAALAQKLDPRLKAETDVSKLARQGAEEARRLAKQTGRPALILLDNVEKPSDAPDWLKAPGLHLVLTSRYGAWPKGVARIEVSELPPGTARTVLLDAADREEGEGVEALLNGLQGLPLALVQAGCYLRENPSESFAGYASALSDRIARTADDWPADQKLVASTYEPSIARADASAPGAAEMLARAAFCAPDDIPLKLLADDPDAQPARKARDALARYSLWRGGEDSALGPSASVHRLVQAVLRRRLDADGAAAARLEAARRLAMLMPNNTRDVLQWPQTMPLVSHIAILSELTPEEEAGPELARALALSAGFALGRAHYSLAELQFRRALAIYEKSSRRPSQRRRSPCRSCGAAARDRTPAGGRAALASRSCDHREDLGPGRAGPCHRTERAGPHAAGHQPGPGGGAAAAPGSCNL